MAKKFKLTDEHDGLLNKLSNGTILLLGKAKNRGLLERYAGKENELLCELQTLAGIEKLEKEIFLFERKETPRAFSKSNSVKPLNSVQLALKRVQPGGLSSEEAEIQKFVRAQNEKVGISVNDMAIICPPAESRTVVSAANGGPAGTEVHHFSPVFDASPLAALGATYVNINAVNTFQNTLPIIAIDADENEEAVENTSSLYSSSAAAKRVVFYQTISKQVPLQNPEVSALIEKDLAAGLTQKLMRSLFGVQAATTKTVQGFGYKTKTGATTAKASVTPSITNVLAMIAEVDALGCMGANPGFITNGKGARLLMRTQKDDSGAALWNKASILDYPAFETASVSGAAGSGADGNLLIFGGDWSKLIVCQFGAVEIFADPYTLAKQNKIILSATAYFDIKGLYGSRATSLDDSTQVDHFAYAWSTLPIK